MEPARPALFGTNGRRPPPRKLAAAQNATSSW